MPATAALMTPLRVLRHLRRQEHPLVSRFLDPCFLVEPGTGRVLDFNALALELLGYEPEGLLAKTIFDLKFGLSREEFRSYVDQIGDRLFIALPVSQLLRRDGSSVSVELNLGLTTVGGIRALLIVARDITERAALFRRTGPPQLSMMLPAQSIPLTVYPR